MNSVEVVSQVAHAQPIQLLAAGLTEVVSSASLKLFSCIEQYQGNCS